jgi:hypothetical protein
MRNHSLRCSVFAMSLLVSASAFAGRVHWPAAGPGRDTPLDPISSVRWNVEGWVVTGTAAPAQMALQEVEEMLAAQPANAMLHADKAVVLRVIQRFDDAQRELQRAIASDAHVLDDPDVTLTQAYLEARGSHWAEAVQIARRALPRLEGPDEVRGPVVIEVARWSMARGVDGVDDAIALLREVSGPSAAASLARATLSLALHRRGRDDEAREVARGAELPSPYTSTALHPGGLVDGEADAAIGTAYLLSGRGHDAIPFLTRAVARAPHVWHASLEASLAEAQRAPALPPPSPTGRPRAFNPTID